MSKRGNAPSLLPFQSTKLHSGNPVATCKWQYCQQQFSSINKDTKQSYYKVNLKAPPANPRT